MAQSARAVKSVSSPTSSAHSKKASKSKSAAAEKNSGAIPSPAVSTAGNSASTSGIAIAPQPRALHTERAFAAVRNFLGSQPALEMWSKIHGLFVPSNSRFAVTRVSECALEVRDEDGVINSTIEVVGDRNDHSGNLFFETSTGGVRGKKSGFAVTESEWYFYYLVNSGHLFCIRTSDAVPWFNGKLSALKDKEIVVESFGERVVRRGKVVPISLLVSELPSTWHFVFRGAWRRLEQSFRFSD